MTRLTLGYSADLEQLGLIVERLPIGVIVFSKERREVVFANNAARLLLHPVKVYTRRPLPSPWTTFSLPDYADHLVDVGVGRDEVVQVDGEHAYLLSGITAPGSNSGVILIEDISERERRIRAEREFVANAAHELLTPLTGIVSAAHVLEAGAKEVPEDRDRFIAHIAYECERLTRIARSLLVLARAQSGEEPPRLEILPVRDLLEETVAHTGHPVELRCDDSVTVLADADLLIQAVANLVSNAIRHGGDGQVQIGALEVSTNLVQIDIAASDDGTTDVGSYSSRFRSAAGRDSGGFGLGLSIAAQSVEVMGGRLLFERGAARIELQRGRPRE